MLSDVSIPCVCVCEIVLNARCHYEDMKYNKFRVALKIIIIQLITNVSTIFSHIIVINMHTC